MSFHNENEQQYQPIAKERFAFVHKDARIYDKELETKSVGYFKDAMMRFCRNKGAIVCFFIIIVLIIYAILAPMMSNYGPGMKDGFYSYALPKLSLKHDLGFWNGRSDEKINQQTYDYYSNIPGAIYEVYEQYEEVVANRPQKMYSVSVDSYKKVGYVTILLTADEYEKVLAYQEETGIQMTYPMIDSSKIVCPAYQDDANAWFLTDQKGVAQRDMQGNIQDIYLKDEASEDGYVYAIPRQNNSQYEIRVLYYDYYVYLNGVEPCFVFGADEFGYNIFSRLGMGARLSLTLSVAAALVNLIIGIIIGALEGYYGGAFDLLFERVKDILWEVPTVVFMTLFQMYFAQTLGPLVAMFLCFIFFGWISTSSTVRAQFYRFKGQEYVMAARTLGAKDRRLIFRHILPNAAGFIITASVLTIPNTIFSEATYSYLGIVNLQSPTLTSVGTMLENGQTTLSTFPHCVFFPALFLSLLLICFNIFGNGLRDAFNPSLRGTEE